MTPDLIGGLLGAFLAFCGFAADKVLPVYSAPLATLFFPGHFLISHANGYSPFGHMMIDSIAYLGSALLYGAVGFGIGRIFTSKGGAA